MMIYDVLYHNIRSNEKTNETNEKKKKKIQNKHK